MSGARKTNFYADWALPEKLFEILLELRQFTWRVMLVKPFLADFRVVRELLVGREIDDMWFETRQQSDNMEEGREGRRLSSVTPAAASSFKYEREREMNVTILG